jgi:hypothetical protein
VVKIDGIEIVDIYPLGEVVVNLWITSTKLGSFVFNDACGIVCPCSGRWLWSEIISNGDLDIPAVGSPGCIAVVRDKNENVDSRPPR